MYLIRNHVASKSTPMRTILNQVRNKYNASVKDGQVMSQKQVDDWIARKFGVSDNEDENWKVTISLEIPADMYEAVLIEDSMDTYYDEKIPKERKNIQYHRTLRRGRCPICLKKSRRLVSIHPCCHLFHKKCIEEWSRWQDTPTCPTCQATINCTKFSRKRKRSRCTRESVPNESEYPNQIQEECLL